MPKGCEYAYDALRVLKSSNWLASYCDRNGLPGTSGSYGSLDAATASAPKGACPKGYTVRTTSTTTYRYAPCTDADFHVIYNCDLNGGLSHEGCRIDKNMSIGAGFLWTNLVGACGIFTCDMSEFVYTTRTAASIGSLH